MNIVQHLFNSTIDYFSKKNNNLSSPVSATDGPGWVKLFGTSGNNILREDYRSFVFSCTNKRAEKVREADLVLYKQQVKDKKEVIQSHPFYNLINTENIYGQSFGEIQYLIAANLDLYGNAFVYYLKNRAKMPAMLILLPANKVKPNFNTDQTQIVSYTYTVGSTQKTYSPEEILHIRLPNPNSLFLGKSTCSAIKSAINTDWYQSIYNENFYKNDASIGLALEFEKEMGDKVYNRLAGQLQAKYSGYESAGKNLILEGGKISRSAATPKEANFIQARLNVRDETFGAFGVSKAIMGYTDDVNRANAEAMNIGFLINTVIPFAKNISDAFTRFVKINYDERLFVENDFDLQKDSAEHRADLDLMMKYKAMTKNELRESYGYGPIPGGDVIKENNNPEENQIEEDGTDKEAA